jgi:hypothetical protein
MPRGMRIRQPNQDDRPGLPSAKERTKTNEPFNEKANTEMIERNAEKKREGEARKRRADRKAGARYAQPLMPEKLC